MSDDMDNKHFEIAYSKHPWLALPYAMEERKHSIKCNFGVNGIPCVVVLNQRAQIVTDRGFFDIQELGIAAFKKWLKI